MFLINASYLLTEDNVLEDITVVFEKKIVAIGKRDELLIKYPQAKEMTLEDGSVLMPGLINSHVHLEFSANKTDLRYGSFMPWLYSVIEKRDELSEKCGEDCMNQALDDMLLNGTTTIGAISSWGFDLNSCVSSKMKVIYFNEVIGSNPAAIDALWEHFLDRLEMSKGYSSETFTPAVAIHSPYSVHPVLVKKTAKLIKEENLQLSTHFLESYAEREWLDSSKGEFVDFFKNFLNLTKSHTDTNEFLDNIKGTNSLVVHAGHATQNELNQIEDDGHTLVHCPVSNRLLGNKRLNIIGKKFLCATDGLSSNTSLNIFDELKTALFIHQESDLNSLSKELIKSVTSNAADALKLNRGRIEVGCEADIIVLNTKRDKIAPEDLHLHILLQKFDVSKVFINGEIV